MQMTKLAKCAALGIAALGILASAGCGQQAEKGEKTYKVSCRRFVDNIIPYGDDALVGEALAEVE